MNSYLSQLLNTIEMRDTRVALIGLGYVGLPLVVAFAEAGHHVIGIDVDRRKVEDMSYIIAAADEIGRYLHPGMLVVRESTTYPGRGL
jgi:UDP-N-acetyl-D-mannosaminuronate dehydrogenase